MPRRVLRDPVGATATDNHPIWVEGRQHWVHADQLHIGDQLRDRSGHAHAITHLTIRTLTTTVHNLTTNGPHTYYVLAGTIPVLVHNAGPCPPWKAEFDLLAAGKRNHVKVVPDVHELRALFERWTKGAEGLPARGAKIPDVLKLDDGTTVQWRLTSRSGRETIDIFPVVG
ncbi:polymorphic toxin-type HINT domain-containing protein [Saccharothrix sp. NPDC042600]|uniref:polymorphic toxin-type HINT domain-containing protein n=1 Tax=Saccharothrix TaxID=2071 RepID=UPI003406B300